MKRAAVGDRDSLSGLVTRKSARSEDIGNNSDESTTRGQMRLVSNSESGQNDSSSSSVATNGASAPAVVQVTGGGGTYPSPSNFPERLMHVLENDIAKDSIWWLGEGEAIAVHPKNIKSSPVLDSHFQGNRYSSFIRNLNRWGFRRVSYHSVPHSVVVYHNSLFVKKKPRLLTFLQMDSDIQDVFERHQLTNDLQRVNNGEPKRASREDEDIAILQSIVKDKQNQKQRSAQCSNNLQGFHQKEPHASRQQQQPQQQPQQQHSQNVPQWQSQQQHSQNVPQWQPQQQHLSSNQSPQAQLAALLGLQLAQPQQQQQQQQGQGAPQQAGVDPSTLGQLLSVFNQQQEGGPADSASVSDNLLKQILPLAERYLDQPSTGSPVDGLIRTLLQLLILLGREQQQNMRQQAPQLYQNPQPHQQPLPGPNNVNLLQQLMLQMGQDNHIQQNSTMEPQFQQGQGNAQNQQRQTQLPMQPITQGGGNNASGATLDGFQQLFQQQVQLGQAQNNPALAQVMQMLGQQSQQQ